MHNVRPYVYSRPWLTADTLMANWICSVFNVVCRKRLSSPRRRSELFDSAAVVIVPGHKCIKKSFLVNYLFSESKL